MLNFHNSYYAKFFLFIIAFVLTINQVYMKKCKTFFGYEGTSVLSSCLAIYAISVWLIQNYYCRELERRELCKIERRYVSPKEIFLLCSHFLNVKYYEK